MVINEITNSICLLNYSYSLFDEKHNCDIFWSWIIPTSGIELEVHIVHQNDVEYAGWLGHWWGMQGVWAVVGYAGCLGSGRVCRVFGKW